MTLTVDLMAHPRRWPEETRLEALEGMERARLVLEVEVAVRVLEEGHPQWVLVATIEVVTVEVAMEVVDSEEGIEVCYFFSNVTTTTKRKFFLKLMSDF